MLGESVLCPPVNPDMMSPMKKLLAIIILILCFITPSQAESIRDFQIEGMSLRDKLTDYLSLEKIRKNQKDWYRTKKFFPVQINASELKSKTYDQIEFQLKPNDNNFIIYGLSGVIHFSNDYPNNINDCYKKQNELMSDLKIMFDQVPNIKIQQPKKYRHGVDKISKSYFTRGSFISPSGDRINVDCNDYSKAFSENNDNLPDKMYISIDSAEFYKFLMSGNAY